MQSVVDSRQRPVVLDTGEIRPALRRRGRLVRAVLDVVVMVLLGVGATAAGAWSIVTAARGNAAVEHPAPLWYPTPASADDDDETEPPATVSSRSTDVP